MVLGAGTGQGIRRTEVKIYLSPYPGTLLSRPQNSNRN